MISGQLGTSAWSREWFGLENFNIGIILLAINAIAYLSLAYVMFSSAYSLRFKIGLLAWACVYVYCLSRPWLSMVSVFTTLAAIIIYIVWDFLCEAASFGG